jgi:hypothetical protein
MKAFLWFVAPLSAFVFCLTACRNPEPSPEAQTRDQQSQKEAAKAQAQFFNQSPPPASKPGE